MHDGAICRSSQLVNERFGAIVTAEGKADGGLTLTVEPISGGIRFNSVHGRFVISVWREGPHAIRMSVRTEASGTTAYLQGGMSLLAVADDLGLQISR